MVTIYVLLGVVIFLLLGVLLFIWWIIYQYPNIFRSKKYREILFNKSLNKSLLKDYTHSLPNLKLDRNPIDENIKNIVCAIDDCIDLQKSHLPKNCDIILMSLHDPKFKHWFKSKYFSIGIIMKKSD